MRVFLIRTEQQVNYGGALARVTIRVRVRVRMRIGVRVRVRVSPAQSYN